MQNMSEHVMPIWMPATVYTILYHYVQINLFGIVLKDKIPQNNEQKGTTLNILLKELTL